MIIVAYASHKTKALFFFLLQSEQGDVFKVTLTVEDEMVSARLYLDNVNPDLSVLIRR